MLVSTDSTNLLLFLLYTLGMEIAIFRVFQKVFLLLSKLLNYEHFANAYIQCKVQFSLSLN